MAAPDSSPNDFVTKSVQQLHQCPVIFLGLEKVTVPGAPEVPRDLEVRAYGLITATAAQRCYAWLDPMAPIVQPRIVCALASAVITSPLAAVQAWVAKSRAKAA